MDAMLEPKPRGEIAIPMTEGIPWREVVLSTGSGERKPGRWAGSGRRQHFSAEGSKAVADAASATATAHQGGWEPSGKRPYLPCFFSQACMSPISFV